MTAIDSDIPKIRVRTLLEAPIQSTGDYVLYWMTAFRRTTYNFALDRAIDYSKALGKPLVVLEAVRVRYPWSSQRFHQFIVDGMKSNQQAFKKYPVLYYPYVEPKPGHGSGLVETLSQRACVVIADDFPCFFHPIMYRNIAPKLSVRMELIDSNGLMPMRATDRVFTVAHSYRRFMQKELPKHLEHMPSDEPFKGLRIARLGNLPQQITDRWPATDLDSVDAWLPKIRYLCEVPATRERGGETAARARLKEFLKSRLEPYDHDRNEPDKDGSSGLSPYMHFGHVSPHEVFLELMSKAEWSPNKNGKPNGKVNGFWNCDASTEAFLDQLLTWREIGFNMCCHREDYDRYESLPEWALETLEEHESDRRPYQYSLEQFEAVKTHDPLWNAAQRQLVEQGKIHNYLRMLWGKKILHWTGSGREALKVMIELNNKYALDGRNPNSYSGIFWVLGRYDRAWGPERPIFGKVRYMTSESTAKKWSVKKYLQRFGEA